MTVFTLAVLLVGAQMPLSATAATPPAWQVEGLLPDVVRSPGNLTAAKWIWHPGIVTRMGEAYYRFAFDLPGEITSARLRIAFDDSGEWYLNGVRQSADGDIAAALRPGRNLLAAHVKNYEGGAGLLAFGEIIARSGASLRLRSSSAFRALAAKPRDGWTLPDFDDSDWSTAREITDAAGQPYSNARDWLADFATPEERARVAAFRAAHPDRLPPGIADEPEPRARIVYDGHLPKIELNGVRYEPDIDANSGRHDFACNVVRKTASLGFVFDQLALASTEYEVAPGVYDFAKFDQLARRLLDCNPDARLFITFDINLPKWCAANPNELVGYGDGPIDPSVGDECTGRHPRPSAASRPYRDEVARLLAAFSAYVRAQPWAKRVVAVRPCWGIYWEWHVFGMSHSPDVGPAMTAEFRRWKNGKYAAEQPPTPAERTHRGYLLDPVKDAKTIDFFECQQSVVADFMIETARALKAGLPGRLVGMYYGYVLTFHAPEGANVMLDKVLAAPEIDFLSDPTMYSAGSRRAGGAHYHRTIPATFHRYGKLAIAEDDMRHFHIREYAVPSLCTDSPREARMTMRRNYLNKLFDGCGLQIFDPGGLSGVGTRLCTHDDPAVMLGLHDAIAISRQVGSVPAESGNDTAVVADWRERLRQDNQARQFRLTTPIYGNGVENAYRSGATFDLMSLDDYLANPKRYAKVVLLNVFNPLPEHLAALTTKFARDRAAVARLLLPGANIDAFDSAAVWPVSDLPTSPRAWADLFAALGNAPLTRYGEYVRRQGNLLLFHTATAGEHELALPPDLADVPATELASGRAYRGVVLHFATDGVDTLIFKFSPASRLVLARRGAPARHTIVCPDSLPPSYAYAADELRRYLARLTGVELPIAASAPAGAPAIVLAPLPGDDRVVGDDFRLHAEGEILRIVGGARGVLYGVYELLETFGGVGWFSSWHERVPVRDEFSVPSSLDRSEHPAFAMRDPFWRDAFVGDFAARLRANGNRAELSARHGGKPHRFGARLGNCHTIGRLLPAARYAKSHPEYWALHDGVRVAGRDRAQPCLTNPEVLAIVATNLLAAIASDPSAPYFGISQDDANYWCDCPNCRKVDAEEGSHAGTYVRFLNALNAIVKRVYPNVTLETLAYQFTRHPTRTPLDRDIMPCLCTIECDFSRPLDLSRHPENVGFLKDISGWAKQVDRLYVWDYVTDFHEFLKPYRNLDAIQANIQFFRRHGVSQLFEQGAYKGWHGEMAELKAWLIAKWMWNPDWDRERLLTTFLAGYYGRAAGYVHDYLDALSAASAKVDERQFPTLVFESVVADPVMTPEFLDQAVAKWRKAELAVSDDKSFAYNVRMGALALEYTRFVRNAHTVKLSRKSGTGMFDIGASARRIVDALAVAEQAGRRVQLCESNEQDRSRKEKFARYAAGEVKIIGDGERARLTETMLNLGARRKGQQEIVKDLAAEDGKALFLSNDNYEWYTTFDFSQAEFDVGAKYRLKVRARAELTGADGEIFSAGYYDAAVTKKTISRSFNRKQVAEKQTQAGYQWYEVCEFAPVRGGTIFIAPGFFEKGKHTESPAHRGIWIDCIEVERVE